MCGWHSKGFREARNWPTLSPRRRPSLLTHRLLCLTMHRGNFKFNLTYVWSKCELFVWSRCTGMGKALLLRCMQEIGGDCLWQHLASTKGTNLRWCARRIETASLGPKASLRAGNLPAAFGIHWMWSGCSSSRTERETNRQTARLTDKYSLSRSQCRTELPSTINYAIIQMWLCFGRSSRFAKSVLIFKYSSLIFLLRFLLLPPIFLTHLLLLHRCLLLSSVLPQTSYVFVYQSTSSVDWTS
jgi:hypothetical protein